LDLPPNEFEEALLRQEDIGITRQSLLTLTVNYRGAVQEFKRNIGVAARGGVNFIREVEGLGKVSITTNDVRIALSVANVIIFVVSFV